MKCSQSCAMTEIRAQPRTRQAAHCNGRRGRGQGRGRGPEPAPLAAGTIAELEQQLLETLRKTHRKFIGTGEDVDVISADSVAAFRAGRAGGVETGGADAGADAPTAPSSADSLAAPRPCLCPCRARARTRAHEHHHTGACLHPHPHPHLHQRLRLHLPAESPESKPDVDEPEGVLTYDCDSMTCDRTT